jgi:hypothetical protein
VGFGAAVKYRRYSYQNLARGETRGSSKRYGSMRLTWFDLAYGLFGGGHTGSHSFVDVTVCTDPSQ